VRRALAIGLAGGGLLALAPLAAAAPRPVPLTVVAKAGRVDGVRAALGRSALRVQRRDGRELQVTADPRRVRGLDALPGVADAHVAPTAFEDDVIGEGYDRTGSAALEPIANGGKGLTIAILDLGFGAHWTDRQAAGELPAADQLLTRSFDLAGGLAGSNEYGHATNHGELVAQTVFDYAPEARYIFVNYRTPQDFLAAVDWLAAQRPNIVVHSNSFLEGPFDGTGSAAQAVDRLAAQGVLWFNSAGNYAGKHWTGPWADADGDGTLDWPNGNTWAFQRPAGQPISFALSWSSPAGLRPSDLDLLLDRQSADGSWTTVARSSDRQTAPGAAAERITGYESPIAGIFRLRVVRAAGTPPPPGNLTLFSREISLSPIGDAVTASLPTPGDAAGSITIGAVDWRGNALKNYSSQGPTADGRAKPDLVAPTNTRVAGPNGTRAVGGTSIAAPNAAGAAAVLWSSLLAGGVTPAADQIRQQLMATALDLGPAGFDMAYGAGLVRVDTDAPEIVPVTPVPDAAVRGVTRAKFDADDGSRIAHWSLTLDGIPLQPGRVGDPVGRRLDTRKLPDGLHLLHAEARDWPGNLGAGDWFFTVDNTAPTLSVRRVTVPPARRALVATDRPGKGKGKGKRKRRVIRRPAPPRPISVTVRAGDKGRAAMKLQVRVRDAEGVIHRRKTITIPRPTGGRRVPLGRYVRGRYRLDLTLVDRAGNRRILHRRIVVR
jgi:subtilase family protein